MALKDYRDKLDEVVAKSDHKGYFFLHVIIILVLYELLIQVFASPHVEAYNQSDIWFYYPNLFFPRGTFLISLTIVIGYGWLLYIEMAGIKTKDERAKDSKAKKEFEKFPYNEPLGRSFESKKKKKFSPNWRYLLVAVGHGFLLAAIFYTLLRFFAFFFAVIVGGTDYIPSPIDSSPFMRAYHTNVLQDIALALGAGFYEEMIFRKWLFDVMGGWVKPYLKEDYFVVDIGKWKTSFLKMGKKAHQNLQAVIPALLAAFLYALVHELLGAEPLSLYTFVYRVLFGLAMTYVLIKHKFATLAWTHVWYDLLFFMGSWLS